MPAPGFLYALINPSLPGLVKIGKTYRDPESRARELSQATGVATPFWVAYSLPFPDCDLAESHAHLLLEQRGFRLMPNREFFKMPLQSAIELLTETQRTLLADTSKAAAADNVVTSLATDSAQHPAFQLFERALDCLHGLGDEIQDEEEAIRLLLEAKTLNFPAAYTTLAEIHFDYEPGSPNKKALEFLKEGAEKGHGRCFTEMATIFSRLGREEDAAKCWKRYLISSTFRNDDDQRWTAESTLDSGSPRTAYVGRYLHWVQRTDREIPDDILALVRPMREELVADLEDTIAFWAQSDLNSKEESVARNRALLDFASLVL